MERVWTFDRHAVTVTLVDFADPELSHLPDVRERGVRVELRPVSVRRDGTIYVSDTVTLEPAVVRVDLLESEPHAADRMHWHPTMSLGEPGDRVLDASMGADPVGWLRELLDTDWRGRIGADPAVYDECLQEISEQVRRILEQARGPWPEVTHDERGVA